MVGWNRKDLERVAQRRLEARRELAPVERVVLAYARWQGLTDEPQIDRDAAKQSLDELLDEMDAQEVSAWQGIERVAAELGDKAVTGLLAYSLARSADQVRRMAEDQPPPDKPRKRRRDRSR